MNPLPFTPPGMRVRTGRFPSVLDSSDDPLQDRPDNECLSTGLRSTGRLAGPTIGCSALRKRLRYKTHPPRAFPTSAGHVNLFPGYSQPDQVASSGSRPSPLFPIVKSHPASQPSFQFEGFAIGDSWLVVVHRSPHVDLKFLHYLPRGGSPRRACDFPQPRFGLPL